MKVQCPRCKFVFEVDPKRIGVCQGTGKPFVSCPNPHYEKSPGCNPILCNEFIDLTDLISVDDINQDSD